MFWAVCAVQSDTRFSVARGDWIYAIKKVEIYKDWPNKKTGGKEKHAQEKMLKIRFNLIYYPWALQLIGIQIIIHIKLYTNVQCAVSEWTY